MQNALRNRLISMADVSYQQFQSGLCPNIDNILGVRIPELRKLAKELVKGNWRTYLATAQHDYYEEVMLQGMVIGYLKTDLAEVLQYVATFVPKINNWAVCDSFCSGLKITKKNMGDVWSFILPYLQTHDDYQIRFAVVMMLDYYIVDDYIDKVIGLLDEIRHDGYYVKMAVAWALSMCFIKYPEKTLGYLKNSSQDKFTYNKALQKIIESHRIDQETKVMIRKLRRK